MTRFEVWHNISCDVCKKLMGYGHGDLNCVDFWCPKCFEQTKIIKAADMIAKEGKND